MSAWFLAPTAFFRRISRPPTEKTTMFKTSSDSSEKTNISWRYRKLKKRLLGANAVVQGVYKWMVQFQKLTRNLFLTLHGQQRQLSKFLMRCQQFAFHAYCGAVGSVSKMASKQEKAFCVLRFEVSRSVITVQREFRAARFRKDTPCMVRLF